MTWAARSRMRHHRQIRSESVDANPNFRWFGADEFTTEISAGHPSSRS